MWSADIKVSQSGPGPDTQLLKLEQAVFLSLPTHKFPVPTQYDILI